MLNSQKNPSFFQSRTAFFSQLVRTLLHIKFLGRISNFRIHLIFKEEFSDSVKIQSFIESVKHQDFVNYYDSKFPYVLFRL